MKIRLFLLLVSSFLPVVVTAETLGIHCWQQAPFKQVFCFEVNNVNGNGLYYALTGENIIAKKGSFPVMGAAVLDQGSGKLRVQFSQHLGGRQVFHNLAIIDVTTLTGTWSDSGDNSGTFEYLGIGPLSNERLFEILETNNSPTTTRQRKLLPVD